MIAEWVFDSEEDYVAACEQLASEGCSFEATPLWSIVITDGTPSEETLVWLDGKHKE